MSNRQLLTQRRLLDLCCGEGLAAWGYWRSGFFSEIVGIDINPKLANRYSFDFISGDVLALDYDFLQQFDFIHASPPCQYYSKRTPDKSKHWRSIPPVRAMLEAAGLPYVIENVEGSSADLSPNLVINGWSVGLSIHRPRYFRLSWLTEGCRWIAQPPQGQNISIHSTTGLKTADLHDLMGLETIPQRQRRKLTRGGIGQGIPPAMTTAIAQTLFTQKVGVL